MKTQAIAFSALLIGALVACSSSSEPTSPNGGSNPNGGNTTTDKNGTDPSGSSSSSSSKSSGTGASAGPTTYTAALCAFAFRCDPTVATVFDSVDACAANSKDYDAAEAAAPGTGKTTAADGKCAAAINAAGCDADIASLPECSFKGTLANGATCYFGVQCSSGNCDVDPNSTTDCGKCADASPVGGDCQYNSCADGLVCNYGTSSATCAAPPKTGETGCGSTYVCANPTDKCIANTCTAVLAKGAACTQAQTGDQDPCPTSQLCVNGTCTDVHASAKTGDACTDTDLCIGGECLSGTCVANVPAGAACDSSTTNCANALECDPDSKTCTTPVVIPSCN